MILGPTPVNFQETKKGYVSHIELVMEIAVMHKTI